MRLNKIFFLLSAVSFALSPGVARAQLGALGGVSGIEEGGKVVGPLFTLSGEVGAADAGSLGFYLFYTQVTRSFGKPLDEVYSGNPSQRVIYEILFFSYNPLNVLQFSVMAPYVRSDVEQTKEVSPGVSQVVKSSSAGLFNPIIRGKFQFLSKPYISLAVSLFPPTGFEGIGGETLDIRTSIALTYKFSFLRLDAEEAYQFSGVWTKGPAPNDTITENISLSMEAGERLSVFFEANYNYGGFLSVVENTNQGSITREDNQQKIDLTPGFRVKVADKIFSTIAAKWGVYNTFYRGYYYFYSIGLDYAF